VIATALLLFLAAEPSASATPSVPPTAAGNELAPPVFAGAGYTKPALVEKNCVGKNLRVPGDMESFSGSATVKFVVMRDGTVRGFEVLTDTPRPLADAIWQAVQSCKFTPGLDAKGTPVNIWMILPLRFKGAGGAAAVKPPHEAEPGCIDNQLHYRFPPNRLLRGTLSVHVGVSPTGEVSAFRFPPDLPDDVLSALTLSIRGCTLRPALDADGAPTAGIFEYRVNFGQPVGAERDGGGGPVHKREAKLSSPTCLQRLKPAGVIGHAVVEVTVTAEGEPTNFRLQPENTPASLRLAIIDVLATCKWEPAIGLDDRPVAGDAEVTIRYR
jgi:hypothetical protein